MKQLNIFLTGWIAKPEEGGIRQMADVTLLSATLGLLTLPKLTWMGSPPSWPVSSNKQMITAVMSDRSRNFAFFGVKGEMTIILGFLTKTQLDNLKAYNNLAEILTFVNNNEDATEYEVVISSFSHEPERMDIRQLERYRVEMTLKEA